MTILRIICGALSLGFIALCVWAVGADHFGQAFEDIWARPWGKAAMVDLYIGFFLIGIIIFAIERWFIALPLMVATFFLGNLITAAWFAWRLPILISRLRSVAHPKET